MKKLFCLLMTLCMMAAVPALAVEDLTGRPLADGVVTAVNYVDVTAPMSGTLTAFDLTAGDAVEAGQTLMGFVTTGIYATEDATVKAVYASEGDDATAAMNRWGAVLGLEPDVDQQVQATTTGAYNSEDTRTLHLGETLYFQSTKSGHTEGTGRVVSVSDSGYVLDILTGDFDQKEAVTLYRNDSYDAKKCVGKGVITRRISLMVQGSVRVAALHVQEVDHLVKGQLLMELVWKGQLLCRIYLTDTLEVVADVDEMDLGTLKVGDTVPVTLDVNKSQVLNGTVTEISALGVTKQNAAYYTVHVSIPAGSGRLGASASIYLQ